jgi:hypothetical protein
MVRNFITFKAFVTFAKKKLEVLLILVEKFWICLCWSGKNVLTMIMAYVNPENFFWPHPPPQQHFQENFLRLGQNPRINID